MVKILKPLINSLRNTVLINYREKLTPRPPRTPRRLLRIIKKKSGRNNQGRFYRVIDFKRYPNDGKEGTVESIEYDPNRSSFISLIKYEDGRFAFIINPEGLKVGDKIRSGEDENVPIQVGNNLPLKLIPANVPIHNIELKLKKGGQLIRGAGTYAEITGKVGSDGRVPVRLRSKTVYRISADCRATIGKVSNSENNLVKMGKAGRNR
jgi:large subunit ribosomal protein L2